MGLDGIKLVSVSIEWNEIEKRMKLRVLVPPRRGKLIAATWNARR